MNTNRLRGYIARYKKDFGAISQREIYKWRAVSVFQTSWDLNADDFTAMLTRALAGTGNLMDSGNYFPRGMIIDLSRERPKIVRRAFSDLFDESRALVERIHGFQSAMKRLNNELQIGKSTYQDARAVLVYLCMRFPESYFLYKFGMLKDVCGLLDVEYVPTAGADENIIQYLNLCELVRNEILEDYDLIRMHYARLTKEEYPDPTLTILTQDLVYAITEYLEAETLPRGSGGSVQVTGAPEPAPAPPVSFAPSFVDFAGLERRSKRIGVLGELLVMEWESQKRGPKNVNHVSQSEGDGVGYDIRSVGEDGRPLFIEVKTTAGGIGTPFEVTRNELEWSKAHPDRYRLYRLYEFDLTKNTAKMYVISGSLESYCDSPVRYRVHWSLPAT